MTSIVFKHRDQFQASLAVVHAKPVLYDEEQSGRERTPVVKRPNLAQSNSHLAKEWHPTRNGDRTPADVSPSWRQPVWWLCEQGHAFQATVHARQRGLTCPLCLPDHTSATEQWLLEQLRRYYPNVQHRRGLRMKGTTVEVDFFLPDLNLAIEYDGPHHARRLKADERKNFRLRRNGIALIRIRHSSLPPMTDAGIGLIVHEADRPDGLQSSLAQLQVLIDVYRESPFDWVRHQQNK